VHLTRGLGLLDAVPEPRERAQTELELLIPLGQALSVTWGRGSLEAERAYARAWTLCQEVGDARQVLSIFLGLGAGSSCARSLAQPRSWRGSGRQSPSGSVIPTHSPPSQVT
jgi:hypothetical protein